MNNPDPARSERKRRNDPSLDLVRLGKRIGCNVHPGGYADSASQ